LLLLLALVARAVYADVDFTTLVSFSGTNGSSPQAGLIQANDGNFYGTTSKGGTNDHTLYGYGTIFKMTPSGVLTTLISFDPTNSNGLYNGAYPLAELIQANDGNFYGTTTGGGTDGYGNIFKMTPSGSFTTLVSFHYGNGAYPYAGLIQANDGNFYGTTYEGGPNVSGTIFKMTPSGTLTTLVSFNGTNGAYPHAGLIQASDGNFYGTTIGSAARASSDRGSVFKMTPSGTFTTLVSFNVTMAASMAQHPQGRITSRHLAT
jgi:uncharacterized repeat protein (TIGR03803 family)